MSKEQQRELERLRELRAKEERTREENEELERLRAKHAAYMQATADMKAQLRRESMEELVVKSEDQDKMIQDYMEFMRRITKKPFDEVPETENGMTKLSFPSLADASLFFQEQSEKNRRFIVVDADTQTVMAYSNGKDGKLYHGDGREFQKGDVLTPSGISHEDFKIPEPDSITPKPR
ncbi:hypothetical protein [Legionella oakridgensis]|uniref:Substrate of the Dot/Icm secretion system n=2 Tax=Legionella oakridgensis TaxID=29423 RepID=W0B988_9GAMM|nr:hypothetical protein [Legionella oakridgensis]AHE67113.1 hypothetical protein Loa_01564 [Legionella oakridgensis ATCC 33761 = DSM 21215]ETO93291.1 hypothetical protein LOR_71c20350 [Legionella oakridgensis RV-2-2007]KTD44429.1 substrate of the Dot/Icm secretion system [Legionella oakridgensis]STY20202.1 Dot/Icm secretion system substrate [Legionella longbeachae]